MVARAAAAEEMDRAELADLGHELRDPDEPVEVER
jgi:hypothetical protein